MKKMLATFMNLESIASSIMLCYAKSSFKSSKKQMYSCYLEKLNNKLRNTMDIETLIEKMKDMSQRFVNDEFDTLFALMLLYNQYFETTYQNKKVIMKPTVAETSVIVYITSNIKCWLAYDLIDSSYHGDKQRWFNNSGNYKHIKKQLISIILNPIKMNGYII